MLFRLIVSVAWIAHIVIYLLISPPFSPFLNEVFIKLDDIWGNWRYIFLALSLYIYVVCIYIFSRNDNFLPLYSLSFQRIWFLICSFSFRSFGHCGICILLLLPSDCSHFWGYDAGNEIGFHYNSSHEVMNFVLSALSI